MNLHRRSVTFQLLLNPRFGGLAFSGLMLPLLNLCISDTLETHFQADGWKWSPGCLVLFPQENIE